MKVLLMHTCGVAGSVAVADEAGVQASAGLGDRRASEELMPAVRRLLEEVGWGLTKLGAVGAVQGPGSFTGVRTGWSVGKGICEALGVPLVGVNRLDLVAGRLAGGGLIHVALDAGRGQFYYGRLRDGVLEWQGLVGRGELEEACGAGGRLVACEGRVIEALRELGVEEVDEPSAGDALGFVMEGLARGMDDVLEDAVYLRQTDAEVFSQTTSAKAGG